MKKTILSIIFLIFIFKINIYAQITLSGYILDTDSKEPLIGATIIDSLSQTGAVSNEYGYYRLIVKSPNVAIRASYVGYSSRTFEFQSLNQDTVLTIILPPSVSLSTVTVVANRDNHIETIQPGKVHISCVYIKRIKLI